MNKLRYVLGVAFLSCVVGCSSPESRDDATDASALTFSPIDSEHAVLWDRQTANTAELLETIVDEFNADRTGLGVRLVHTGGYGDIFRKVTASIQARTLPAMAVAYETMTSEYVRKGAAAPLGPLAGNAETGFSAEDWDDFFPAFVETNRFEEYGGELYSFPYTKSVLLLYSNMRVLHAAGIDAPPATWDEFLSMCRRIKAESGITPLSLNVSASTFTAIVYSMGGDVVRDGRPNFDSEACRQAFALLDTMVREELIYQNPPGTYEDQTAFGQDRLAFNLRPSSNLFYIGRLMEDYDTWRVSDIPQGDAANPGNILYGANICVFRTTDEQQQAAWDFIRYFTSREVTARWSIGTGYLPVRRSAAESPAMREFFAQRPHHRVAFDLLDHARPEPNVSAWQETRGLIENAMVGVLSQMKSGEQAAADLQREATTLFDRVAGR